MPSGGKDVKGPASAQAGGTVEVTVQGATEIEVAVSGSTTTKIPVGPNGKASIPVPANAGGEFLVVTTIGDPPNTGVVIPIVSAD